MKIRLFTLLFLSVVLLSSLLGFAGPVAASDDEGQYDLKLKGPVQVMPAGRLGAWIIAGQSFTVDAATVIREKKGPAKVGAWVEVKARLQADGSRLAVQIETKKPEREVKVEGLIQELTPAFWTVGSVAVDVNASTRVKKGMPRVGYWAEVKATLQPDGRLLAREIEVKSPRTTGSFEFYGTVESLPAGLIGTWTVSGIAVQVTDQTWIDTEHGQPAVGALVEVKGQLQANGSVLASKIEVKGHDDGHHGRVKFYGTVESIPEGRIGIWVIAGQNVQVTAQTRIEEHRGPAVVGAYVEVKAWPQADGTLLADEIEVE